MGGTEPFPAIPRRLRLVDGHCHLQDPRLEPDLPGILERAQAAGVEAMVCCGTREDDWGAVVALAVRHQAVVPMLGLHPWYVGEAQPGWADRLRGMAERQRVGIGECGLDFAVEGVDRGGQELAFRVQIRLALELDRPLAIHCRKAWARLLLILGEEGLPAAGGLVHAYSGSLETGLTLQEMGLHLSFGGALTWPGNAKTPKALLGVAGNRLLFESDAPDMLPAGAAGLNEPANLPLIAMAAAQLRGEEPAALARQTHANAMMLFGGLLK